jgi:YD repeat-containing protein
MCRRVALRSSLRITLVLLIGLALLPLPRVSMFVSAMGQGRGPQTAPPPRPGKPEGELPDLDDLKHESSIEREPPAPIPSTIRSQRNSGKPWDGRRVGDPPLRDSDQAGARGQTLRSHARRRMRVLPVLYEDQFIQNFFNVALVRSATSEETLYWNYQLRAGYNESAWSLKSAAIEFGRTLFESAAYAARGRDAHVYVYDLYKTYLMREPDAGGWATWEGLVSSHGREYVRRGFEESGEFASLLAAITLSGAASVAASSLISARVDPRKQPGNGMLTRDAALSLPLLSLPGRNGLDLGLALSYSSMVWTRSGPYIYFDEDNGFPSPGFRLGFPTVQRKVFDAQTGKQSYLMITAGGTRVELRQVGTSNIYDATDSSYLRLTDNGPTLLVHATDGTKLSFSEINGEFRCVEIKDSNGNYITVNNNALGRITSIVDTLGRVINFNYDGNANLISITQAWNGQPSHQWVSFGWGTRTMQSSFSGAAVVGTANGAVYPVLTQVAVNDTSYFTFDYTNSLQVSLVKKYFGSVERNATSFTYETPANDVPRLISSSVSAQNWTGINGVPAQVTTQYSVGGDGACVLTAPDSTVLKEYYGTGWQRGLTTLSEVWSGGVRQKWTTTAWTQDNTSVAYEVNPRVTETNVYDAGGNRRRTTIDYGTYAAYGLPYAVHEYAADGSMEIRQTFTDYNLSQAYLERRIIGLVSQVRVANGAQTLTKVTYDYDDPARLHGVPAAATQHDVNYNLLFTARGNVTAVSRWDVGDINNTNKKLTSYTNYYNTGTPISTTDPAGHQSNLTYGDSFSDNVNRNTFAYPTTITNADNFSSYVQYHFDFGATTRTQSPAPANQSQGAIQTMTYNSLGQLERITTTNNGAYKRFWYGANFTASFATVNTLADEAYSVAVVDGFGRVTGTASNHPGSSGGYSAVSTIYDRMGRTWKVSNPTEISESWQPSGVDGAGYYYTQQTYDWKGRPLITTNTDGTTKEASYAGCGCAGGEVVTLTDEGTIYAGVAKRRQQKIYSDVLGRTFKTELLNWQGGSVYSATVNTFNVRDQITNTKQYAGPESPANPYRETTATYDGYGRLQTKHIPQESAGSGTTWTYNADSTVSTITDARGAVSSFGYVGTNRGLVKTITHILAGKPTVNITFSYDAAGNRTVMTDQTGSSNYYYDELSRLTSESRTLAGTPYTLSYQYNLGGQLKKMTYPGNMSINYSYDNAGRLTGVTGSGTLYQGVSQYASGFSYRAWGARKTMTDGANRTSTTTYDARLRPLTYQIDGGVVNQSYEYYNDGSMRLVHNASDSNFDRLYEYDQAGRLVFATTGGAARGDLGSIPYHETFGYNAWGDTTSRFTETWSQNDFGDAGSFTNGRRDGWGYEADGQIKTIDTRTYDYDAVGNRTAMTGQLWSGSNYFPTSTTNAYDGDGRRVQEVLSWPSPFTTRYLRSSVLGGEIAQEINSGGQTISYVYLPDGTQLSTLIGFPKWRHETPARTGLYENYQSGFVNRVEFDPVGANVGLTAPPPPDTNGGDGDIGGSHNGGSADSRFSDMANPAAGCYNVGGVELPCTWSLFDVFDMFVWTPARNAAASAPPDSPGKHVPPKRVVPINIPNPFDKYVDDPVERVDTTYTPGYWKPAPAPFLNITIGQSSAAANQQNPGRLGEAEHDILANDLNQHLSFRKDCTDFVKALLRTVAINTQRPAYDDVMDVFDMVRKQRGVVVDTEVGRRSHSAEAHGAISGNSATLRVASISFAEGEVMSAARGDIVLAETLHFAAKQGVFLDSELAWAGYQVAWAQGYSVAPPPATNDREKNSNYFHNTLQFAACNPYQKKK